MPYIKKEHRYFGREPQDVGELNYAITTLCIEFLQRKGLRYTNLNSVVGVLECAKLELYRRVVGKYEDQKIAENGDVFPIELGGYNQ